MASTTSGHKVIPPNDNPRPPHLPPQLQAKSVQRLVLAFALLNATLYACFLPLWEGFDEPFHYAYVQSLSSGHIPVFGKAYVSREIVASFSTVPLSRFLSGTAGTASFEEWFSLPISEKQARVAQRIDPVLRCQPSSLENYEAQQAPLAYALLVPFDLALSHVQLRWRILGLRLIASLIAVALLWIALSRFQYAAIACAFSSQMLWATVAHVGNDYLAVPLTTLFLVWLGKNTRRDLLILSFIFAAGLLTKAYFLAFAPIFIAYVLYRKRPLLILIPALIAGPWYFHNKLLYGSFSGTQQAVAGIGFVQALKAVPQIPWLSSTLAFLHWSLWTGNWSFLSFSRITLDSELILIAIGLALYFRFYRTITVPDRWRLASCACFIAALIYQTCVTYIHTAGASLFAEPWYWQGILCFVWVLVFRGLEQGHKPGRVLAIATVLLCAWIAAVTYVAKLLPLYGSGFGRATMSRAWTWWMSNPTQDLSTVALASPQVVYCLLLAFLVVLVWMGGRIVVTESRP